MNTVPRRWQDLSVIQQMAFWQAPLVAILSLEIGLLMWGLWLVAWLLSFARRWWLQLPILATLIYLTSQFVPVKSADFFILILVILLPFTWRLDEDKSISPAGLCPTIFLAGSVFIFQTQFIVLLGLVAWLLAFLLWFTTALTGFRLSAISIRWLPIIAGSIATAAVIVVIFTIIPRLGTGFIPSFATASQEIGLTDELTPGGMSDLLESDEVAFRALPVGKRKSDEPYWRVFVLSHQKGNRWLRDGSLSLVNDFVTTASDKIARYQILTDSHDLSYVPVPGFPASSAKAVSDGYGFNKFGEALLSKGRDTRQIWIEAIIGDTHAYDYPFMLAENKTNPKLQAYGKMLRRSYPDDKAFIGALMAEFADNFSYSTTVSFPKTDSLDHFYFQAKEGFCSYFATSLAVLLRAGGLEAHVVTGYLGGDWNSYGNYWLVKQSDAHAWVEVRASDGKWYRLDPTALARQSITSGFTDITNLQGQASSELQRNDSSFLAYLGQAASYFDSLNLRVTLAIMNYGDDSISDANGQDNEDRFALMLAVVGLAMTILFVVFTIVRFASHRGHGRPASEKALESLISSHSQPRGAGESLIEHTSKMKQLDGACYEMAQELALQIYQARFGTALERSTHEASYKSQIKLLARMIKQAKKASSS